MTDPAAHSDDADSLELTELLKEGDELLAAATIAITAEGEYSMHVADVAGASIIMTPAQKAHALRMLATAVEAEAILKASDAGEEGALGEVIDRD